MVGYVTKTVGFPAILHVQKQLSKIFDNLKRIILGLQINSWQIIVYKWCVIKYLLDK